MDVEERAASVSPADSRSTVEEAAWSPAKRFGFRVLAVYFLLYTIPFPLDRIPWLGQYAASAVDWLWRATAPWVGAHVLGLEGEMFLGPTGSGDTTFDYVRLLMMVVLTVVLTGVWTLLDRRRPRYATAARWLVVGCRYYLGVVMLNYGIAKVIPTQFSLPTLTRLLTPYGDSSPMGIVWTFMGLSPAYTVFAGLGETVGGTLLFFRRTRSLGAAVVVGVMSNVVMLNYAYDVPVKLYSSHLLLMAVALLSLDARRLVDVFWRNRPAPAADLRPLFSTRRANLVGRVLGLLLLATTVVTNTTQARTIYSSFGNGRPRSSLWGIHDVERFVLDGVELPPLLTDETRWRALVVDRALPTSFGSFSRPGMVAVLHMDGSLSYHRVELDEESATLTLLPREYTSSEAATEAGAELDVLRWERPEPGTLVLRGTWQGAPLEVRMHERDLSEMELTGRGYHWINELPYNR